MATTYDQQQQGSANKDLAQKNEAKVPASSDAAIQASDNWKWLVTLGTESPSYEGFYAVASCVRNRVNASGFPNTYKGVVSQSGQFAGYRYSEFGKPKNSDVARAATEVLRGGASSVRDYPFFLGRIGKKDIWYEKNKAGSNIPIVAAPNDSLHNVYFKSWGTVHNSKDKKTSDAVIIYNGQTGKWSFNNSNAQDSTTDAHSGKDQPPATAAKNNTKPASTTAPTTAINIDVQAAITFNKRVNAGRVKAIQTLVGTKADGAIGPNTVNKIAEWQQKHNLTPDGKFGSGSLDYAIKNCGFKDPLASGGNTNPGTTNANSGTNSPATGTSHTLGSNSPTWCTNNGFINSKKLEDLKGNFKTVATDVIGGLRTAGASITVTATFRHPMRAATMYYARYYNENKTKANKAQEVFKQYGISMSATAAGAKAALSAFGVANGGKAPVGLYSNHREGHAVDMKITKLPASFSVGGVTIKTGGNKGGVTSNAQALHSAIQKSSSNIKDSFKWYGASDNVHWSLTGR